MICVNILWTAYKNLNKIPSLLLTLIPTVTSEDEFWTLLKKSTSSSGLSSPSPSLVIM